MTNFGEIEKYIHDEISKNHGIFNRDSIIKQSSEWIQKFPVEFNSILNFIENEGRNDMMDDAPSSVVFGSRIADESSSVVFGSRFADESSSVAFGSRIDDDLASSVVNMHDQMSSVSDSPMGSDHIDSSPGGYPDDDFDSYMPLQRTMSSTTPRN